MDNSEILAKYGTQNTNANKSKTQQNNIVTHFRNLHVFRSTPDFSLQCLSIYSLSVILDEF